MKIIINPPREQWDELLARPVIQGQATEGAVGRMLDSLQEFGWDEVCRMTETFDGYFPEPAQIPEMELKSAGNQLPEQLKQSIALAANNIRKFHKSQMRHTVPVAISNGITCYQKWVPVERVGLYIPGGTAPLFSTVLMLAIPAQIAGCSELVLCSPGNKDGRIHPAILYAAAWCGITKVFRIGGVQAIGAMAYGLGPVPKVDKLFGPGNGWVTLAKQLVSRTGVAIDMPAGPSELLIVADDTADPAFIAADLLSQAEHGSDSQVLLLTTSWELAEQVNHATELQLITLPRKSIAAQSLQSSKIIVCPDEGFMMEMVNLYAPEHLVLATDNHSRLAEKVKHAGSVFLGHHSPESAGDYASGTNHTLPTSGYAKAYSGLSLDSFMKTVSFQELTAEGLRSIAPAIMLMARAEGLEAHARAAEIRVNSQPGDDSGGNSGSDSAGSQTHFLDYLNPLNILNPLNLFDPENELSPLTLLNRLSATAEPIGPYKPKVQDLIRPNIARLVPYSSARDEFSGHEGIFLDANENPNENGMNRYPDPRQAALREEVSFLKGVSQDQVFLGNGSDEAIDLLIRIFCEPRQSRIITMSPTYGMYAVCAAIQDTEVDRVLLNNDFSLNLVAIFDAIRFDTRMIFLCSPNNPTGNQIPLEQIGFLARRFPGIVVVDEAYIDFAEGPSALELIGECPNLVVLQTFSKAWGLAGVRLGMAFAVPEIITVMNKVKYPYNVNVLSAAAVSEVVRAFRNFPEETGARKERSERKGKPGHKRPDVRNILWERIRLSRELRQIPAVEQVFPSEANFLLVRFADPIAQYRYLADKGIIVRDRSGQPLCEGCLRITVGTPDENDRLIEALKGNLL